VSWPDDPLAIRIEIALDGPDRTTDPDTWTWEDISEYGREAPQIVIGQGDADEWGETPPATCRLTLDNGDGRFSRRNASGPYYGRFGRSTPIRISVDPDGNGWAVRFFGEVQAWPKRWDRSALDATVAIECAGVSRRLGQNEQPAPSALTGYLASTGPVAWWPLEDGVDSTQAASGLPDGTPMTVRRGAMDFVDDAPAGASGSAHPDPSAVNQLVGTVSGASSSAWQVGILTRGVPMDADQIPDPPGYAYWVPLEIRTSTGAVWRIIQQTHDGSAGTIYALALALYATADATTPIQAIGWDAEAAGEPGPLYGVGTDWRTIQVTVEQTGSDAAVALYMDGVQLASATWTSLTIGTPVAVAAVGAFAGGADGGISSGMEDLYVSHIVIHDGAALVPMHEAATGFVGELAADRVARLCAEADVPVRVLGSSGGEAMGAQRSATLMALLRECEAVDGGTLMDDPSGPGLLYIPRAERYNLPAVTLRIADGDLGDAPEATDDDQAAANQVTVSRVGGSSYTARDEADIAASGITVADSVSLNLADDDQLPSHAGWRLHLLAVDEDRWPRISLNLGRRPGLIPWWLGVIPGVTRIRVDDPPAAAGPTPIDVIVEGYTETIDSVSWTVDLYCVPARPWDVAVVDGEQRVAADGSTLAYPMGAADTDAFELSSTPENGPWTTNPADYPLLIRVGGEIVEASGADPQRPGATLYTFDATVEGWAGEGTTTVARVTSPVHDGAGALQATKTMTGGTDSLRFNDGTGLRDLSAGGGVLAAWVLVPAGTPGTDWAAHLELQDPSFAWIPGPDVPLTPGVWTQVTYRPDPALLASCRALGVQVTATGVGGPGVAVVDTVTQIGAQTIHLSQRGVNGVRRAWPAGTEVDVAYPAIVSL